MDFVRRGACLTCVPVDCSLRGVSTSRAKGEARIARQGITRMPVTIRAVVLRFGRVRPKSGVLRPMRGMGQANDDLAECLRRALAGDAAAVRELVAALAPVIQ